MDPNRKIPKRFTKKFVNKIINKQYFNRKTGLKLFTPPMSSIHISLIKEGILPFHQFIPANSQTRISP